ncbi:MAG: hypothetical protein C0501_21315 [Isosphaera sp.]|nr:hypothetical protein [Isosphaera sp.]
MAKVVRGLLTLGNGKVGQSIHLFSLPALLSCPGRSPSCTEACYARKSRYLLPAVVERLRWNYDQTLDPAFAARMIREIRKKGCLAVRIHGAGDLYSADYVNAWVRIASACPAARFYGYTRSHAVPEILPALCGLAGLKNVRLWFSCDRDIPVPETVPEGVRVCYLQTEEQEAIPKADLVFRVKRYRRQRLPLTVVCPSDSPGKREVVCGSCQRCIK